ncbi:MAG: histidine kinase, partial [Flavobacteriaceae bacterium]|nr:histidine kinase [Flavobacteriaceae bacterium]
MNTKLNRSDYLLLLLFYIASATLNCIEYYNDGEDLIEYLIDIPASTIFGLTSLFVFMYFIIPSFLVKQKKYF